MRSVPRIVKPCGSCGKPVSVRPVEHEAGRGRYCSRRCAGLVSGKAKLAKRSVYEANSGSFKAGEHLNTNHPRWVEPIRFTCEFCGSGFELKPWVVRQNGGARFCSKQCRSRYRSVFMSGSNAPDYVGGKLTYRGPDWIEARTVVIVDQKGACAHCGKFLGKKLPVHHIKPFREFETSGEANVRSNLVGLCQSCHMKAEPRVYAKQGSIGEASTTARSS